MNNTDDNSHELALQECGCGSVCTPRSLPDVQPRPYLGSECSFDMSSDAVGVTEPKYHPSLGIQYY